MDKNFQTESSKIFKKAEKFNCFDLLLDNF